MKSMGCIRENLQAIQKIEENQLARVDSLIDEHRHFTNDTINGIQRVHQLLAESDYEINEKFDIFTNVLELNHAELVWKLEQQTEVLIGIGNTLKQPRATRATESLKIGINIFRKGKVKKSIKVFKEGLMENPDDYRIYIALGHAYLAKEELFKALDTFKDAFRMANTNYYRSYGLLMNSYVYFRLNDRHNSIKHAKEAVRLSPECPEFHYYYATYIAQDPTEKSIKKMLSSLRDSIERCDIYYYKAMEDSMFSGVRTHVNMLLKTMKLEKQTDVKNQFSKLDENKKKFKIWLNLKCASANDIRSFELLEDNLKAAKSKYSEGKYCGYVEALRNLSIAKQNADKVKSSIKNHLNRSNNALSYIKTELNEISHSLNEKKRSNERKILKITFILLLVSYFIFDFNFEFVYSVVMGTIYVFIVIFLLLLIGHSFVSYKSGKEKFTNDIEDFISFCRGLDLISLITISYVVFLGIGIFQNIIDFHLLPILTCTLLIILPFSHYFLDKETSTLKIQQQEKNSQIRNLEEEVRICRSCLN